MPPPIIEANEPLQALTEQWRDENELAFDLEGDGLYRYRSQLCAVQLATRGGEVRIIDTLTATERPPLAELLGPRGPRKTVHDVSYDARLLAENAIELGHVRDTSVHARFLDEPKAGLDSLIEKHVGVKLPKGKQKADWGRRPLRPEDLEYLAADVRYLLELGDKLEAAVKEAGIAPEVQVETAYLLHRALTDEPDPRPPWARIKKTDDLDDLGLAVLREVAAVREAAAQKADVPPFKIVGNRQLLDMAKRKPKSKGALAKIPGATRGRARRFTRDFLEAVQVGLDAGGVPEHERQLAFPPAPPRAERDIVKGRERALTSWRNAEAKERKVNRQVVLPGHCVRDLASFRPMDEEELRRVPGLGEVRVDRYAEALLKALDEGER